MMLECDILFQEMHFSRKSWIFSVKSRQSDGADVIPEDMLQIVIFALFFTGVILSESEDLSSL